MFLVLMDGNQIHASCDVIKLPDDDSEQDYEAVSYVWGPGREAETIYCDGSLVEVPTTLAPALRYIWKQWPKTRLWCDSVCINQKNDEEKSGQVAMMDRIFNLSRKVLVWLGFQDGREAFEILKSIKTDSTDQPGIDLGPMETQQIAELAKLDWFCRVWTFQEVRLATKAIVLCDGNEMEWMGLAWR